MSLNQSEEPTKVSSSTSFYAPPPVVNHSQTCSGSDIAFDNEDGSGESEEENMQDEEELEGDEEDVNGDEEETEGDNNMEEGDEIPNMNEDDPEGARIRKEIEEHLDSVDLQGTFAFCQSYGAPFPALAVGNIGIIGTPLTSYEAERMQSQFTCTEVNKTVWEMDGSQATFKNPAWSTWLSDVVGTVCSALGVDAAVSHPKPLLRKVLLHKTGSQYAPVIETEIAEKTFATLVILLPSEFTDGSIHVSLDGETNVFDTSGVSSLQTTILAWHTGANHELKSVTSGHRFALLFDLVHTGEAPPPSLATANQMASRLRHTLLSWSQSSDTDLDKIIIMLDHKYPKVPLSSDALQGTDARLFTILDGLATELGMCMGLVNVQHTQHGSGRDELRELVNRKRGGWGHNDWDDDDDMDDGNVELEEVEEEETTLKKLVNAKGKLIQASLEFDDEREMIPRFEDFDFDAENWDDQTYDGWQGDYAGSVTRSLVIWPYWSTLGSGHGANRRYIFALETLRQSSSVQRTDEETVLFNYVLENPEDLSKSEAIKVLCPAARRWMNRNYWESSLKVCTGNKSDLLSIEELSSASKIFGFSSLSVGLREFVLKDTSNASRFEFISRLVEWASTVEDNVLQHEITEFVATTRRLLFLNIRPPKVDEVQLLVNEVENVSDVKNVLMPQLVKAANDAVLEVFSTKLGSVASTLAQTSEDRTILQGILRELLASQMSKIDFFYSKELSKSDYSGMYVSQPKVQRSSPKVALAFLKKCVDAGHPSLAMIAIKHITNMNKIAPLEAQARAKSVLLPLVPLLLADSKLRAALPNELVVCLGRTAVKLCLDHVQTHARHISQHELGQLLDVAEASSNVALIAKTVLPVLKALPWSDGGWNGIIEELHSRNKRPPAELGDQYRTTAYEMVKVYAAKVSINTMWHGYPHSNGLRKASPTFEFCFARGGSASLQIAVQRALQKSLGSAEGVINELVPLYRELISIAQKYGVSPTQEPFTSAIRKILLAWIALVLGPQPPKSGPISTMETVLAHYSCSCQECSQVKAFLRGGTASITLARIGAPKRRHVEKELSNTNIRQLVTYKMIGSVPQGLEIHKPAAVYEYTAWSAKQARGHERLRSIGPEALQKQVLGSDYNKIIKAIGGGSSGLGPSSNSAPRASTSSARPSTIAGLISGARARGLESQPARRTDGPRSLMIGTSSGVGGSSQTYKANVPGIPLSHNPWTPTAIRHPIVTTSSIGRKRKAAHSIDLTTPSPEPEPKRAR